MKRSFRDAWVAKLRSGEVKQTRNVLCRDGRRCCLGVAYMIDDCGAEIRIDSDVLYKNCLLFDGRPSMPLSMHLTQWGLSREMAEELASMNDGGKSFNEIADYIEQNIPVED